MNFWGRVRKSTLKQKMTISFAFLAKVVDFRPSLDALLRNQFYDSYHGKCFPRQILGILQPLKLSSWDLEI